MSDVPVPVMDCKNSDNELVDRLVEDEEDELSELKLTGSWEVVLAGTVVKLEL